MVRIIISNTMLMVYNDTRSLIQYAETKLHDLYDEHDGQKLPDLNTPFDDRDTLSLELVRVITNFSKERVDWLLDYCGRRWIANAKS